MLEQVDISREPSAVLKLTFETENYLKNSDPCQECGSLYRLSRRYARAKSTTQGVMIQFAFLNRGYSTPGTYTVNIPQKSIEPINPWLGKEELRQLLISEPLFERAFRGGGWFETYRRIRTFLDANYRHVNPTVNNHCDVSYNPGLPTAHQWAGPLYGSVYALGLHTRQIKSLLLPEQSDGLHVSVSRQLKSIDLLGQILHQQNKNRFDFIVDRNSPGMSLEVEVYGQMNSDTNRWLQQWAEKHPSLEFFA